MKSLEVLIIAVFWLGIAFMVFGALRWAVQGHWFTAGLSLLTASACLLLVASAQEDR